MTDETIVRVTVRLTPRAGRDEVVGLVRLGDDRDAFAVRVAAPPVDGAANRSLVGLLARQLGLPRSAVRIASGDKSRVKIVELEGAA